MDDVTGGDDVMECDVRVCENVMGMMMSGDVPMLDVTMSWV